MLGVIISYPKPHCQLSDGSIQIYLGRVGVFWKDLGLELMILLWFTKGNFRTLNHFYLEQVVLTKMTNYFMIQPLMFGTRTCCRFHSPHNILESNTHIRTFYVIVVLQVYFNPRCLNKPLYIRKLLQYLNSHNISHTSRMYKKYTEFASVVSDDRMIA